jgi:hypothetical protein
MQSIKQKLLDEMDDTSSRQSSRFNVYLPYSTLRSMCLTNCSSDLASLHEKTFDIFESFANSNLVAVL